MLAIPETASVKSVFAIASVSELEYGLIERRPPTGAPESGVTVKAVGGEATPARLIALTDCAPLPVLEPSNATSTSFPIWVAPTKPPSVVNK